MAQALSPTAAPRATICVDGFNLALAKGSGIATYGRNLLGACRSLGFETQALYGPRGKARTDLEAQVLIADADRGARPGKSERFVRGALSPLGRRARPVSVGDDVIWPRQGAVRPEVERFWLADNLFDFAFRGFSRWKTPTPVTFGGRPPSVMQWTCPLPVRAKGVPNVYTFHDIIPLRLPRTTVDDKAGYYAMCRAVVRRADHLVAVSEATRRDMVRFLGVEESRVTVTWQAVDIPEPLRDRSDDDVAAELEDAFALKHRGYFLYYGAIEPKKNLGRLVQAWLASGVNTPLVIVGGRAWLSEEESGLLDGLLTSGGAAGDRIRRYEYMPFPLLVSLIQGARATLFPSLYEGFGLPVLESMLLGTPVMTSREGALAEAAGEAALLVDPYDINDMARGIRTLDADTDMRSQMAADGRRQAAFFSPDRYRERLRALYGGLGLI